MTNLEILQSYISMVDFIADICGPSYEVVLHDISNPDNSVIAIRNNHITGRKIGSPMTDLALKILKNKDYSKKDLITNYDGYNDLGKTFLSSTYFIKNTKGSIIGMICVNNDITDIKNLNDSFELIKERFKYREENHENETETLKENIKHSLESTAHDIIIRTINDFNIPSDRMSPEEKVTIVHKLDSEGVFLVKGALSFVAKQLDISDSTVYRYLNKAQYKNMHENS